MKKILLLLGASTLVSGAAACYTGIDASFDKPMPDRERRQAVDATGVPRVAAMRR